MRRRLLIPLFWLTCAVYGQSLGYGFIWDDPLWYGHVSGRSLVEVLGPQLDFQFYRPGIMLVNWLLARPDGTFSAPLLHGFQLAMHLLTIALLYALFRRLGLARGPAQAGVALFALFPLSHQAIAWAGPHQTLVNALIGGAFLAWLAAQPGAPGRPWRRGRLGLSLLLFALGLTVLESAVVLAVMPLLISLTRARREPAAGWRRNVSAFRRTTACRLALAYVGLAAAYAVFWLLQPRLSGYTRLSLDGRVIAYLAQGFVGPLLGRPAGYAPGPMEPDPSRVAGVLGLALVLIVLMLLLARRQGRGGLAALGVTWASLALLPAAIGLDFAYISLASRLFYSAAPGVVLLWVAALTPLSPAPGRRPPFATLLLAAVLLQSALLLGGFNRLYRAGTRHMAELEAVATPGARLLFLNFPDRFAPRRAPYPLGYWGLTLAPVSVDLAAFTRLSRGVELTADSASQAWIDADSREAGPWHVDLRGVSAPPEALWALAPGIDAVYLSRYGEEGSFRLERQGRAHVAAPGACELARFGEVVCLDRLSLAREGDALRVTLGWSAIGPAGPHDIVFVHLGEPGRAPLAQLDGHPWANTLPMKVWQPGVRIEEERLLPWPAALPTGATVNVGIYDWVEGERLPAWAADGTPLTDGIYAAAP